MNGYGSHRSATDTTLIADPDDDDGGLPHEEARGAQGAGDRLAEPAERLVVVVDLELVRLPRGGQVVAAGHGAHSPLPGGAHHPTSLPPTGGQRAVEHVVDGDRADEPTRLVAHTDGEHVVAGQSLGDLSLAEVGRDGGLLLEAAAELHARRLAQQSLEVHHTQVRARGWLVRRLHHEHLRGDADQPFGVADLGQRIGHGGGGAEDDDVGRHQRPGGAVFVGEQAAHHVGVLVVHRVEDAGALLAGHLGQQVGEVVVLHLLEHADEPVEVEAFDDAQLLGLGQLLEQVGQALVVHRRGQQLAVADRQRPHHRGHVAGVHVAQPGRLGGHLAAGAGGAEHLGHLVEVEQPVARADGAGPTVGPGAPWRSPTTSGDRRRRGAARRR